MCLCVLFTIAFRLRLYLVSSLVNLVSLLLVQCHVMFYKCCIFISTRTVVHPNQTFLPFSSLTRESIGREAELEMKLAIVSNALMKVRIFSTNYCSVSTHRLPPSPS